LDFNCCISWVSLGLSQVIANTNPKTLRVQNRSSGFEQF
jgi:hypothetical protein